MPAATVLLAVALLGAGAYALLHDAPEEHRVPVAQAVPTEDDQAEDPGADPHGQGSMGDPPFGPGMENPAGTTTSGDPTHLPDSLAAGDESPSIEWTVPAGWRVVANASSMRLATYVVPHAPADAVDGDVSVTRAGGDVAANVARWRGQFESAGADGARETPRDPAFAEATKTVRGMEVTVVSLEGSYSGSAGMGMDPSAPPSARPGWALLAAIVRSRGQPYFFKMTGPAATVHAARPAFDALVASIKPVR